MMSPTENPKPKTKKIQTEIKDFLNPLKIWTL